MRATARLRFEGRGLTVAAALKQGDQVRVRRSRAVGVVLATHSRPDRYTRYRVRLEGVITALDYFGWELEALEASQAQSGAMEAAP